MVLGGRPHAPTQFFMEYSHGIFICGLQAKPRHTDLDKKPERQCMQVNLRRLADEETPYRPLITSLCIVV